MTQPSGYGPPPGHPAGPYPYPPPPYYYVPVKPPPPLSPAGVPLADFGTRLVAYIIDVALVSAVAFVLAIPGFVVVIRRLPDPNDYAYSSDYTPGEFFADFFVPFLLLELGLVVLILVLYYLYDVEYMHRSGQTLGKKVMKIRVVPIDPSRGLTRGMAAKRYLVQYVGGCVVPFFSYLDGLWQLWDKPYQQTLHDKAAQTVVVKVSA